uniref:uncharacterized protein LOC122592191 n=1 Tax=Erigeron canadensis TaxID=72917 RepID=UPI001CB9C75C|nr:uncharacterized protein LOC122592191 [Erigeron canadensis]
MGGLLVSQVTTFKKIWSTKQGGPDNLGTTFYEPSDIPQGFSSFGSYAHPNNIPFSGHILVGKDVSNNHLKPALKSPIDYILRWSSHSLNVTKDGEGYVWLPNAPAGYKAIGYVITSSSEKPPLDRVSCVREDLTDTMTNPTNADVKTITFEDINVHDLGGLNVYHSKGGFALQNERLAKLSGDAMSSMPNLTQIEALIKSYAPIVYFHPDEKYFPSAVHWFFNNGALLYKTEWLMPIPIENSGSNLPQGETDDGRYWIGLPKDEATKERIKAGDLQDANAYFHVKPVDGGLSTDIVIWLFYPFNGPSRAQVMSQSFILGPLGEHVGDWEHVTLRISNVNGELSSIYFATHSWGEWVSPSGLDWTPDHKPIVYSALFGHGSYSKPGTVLRGFKGTSHVIGLRDDMSQSSKSMDTGARAVVVAAEYLADAVVEPPWLNYMRKWGPKIQYGVAEELQKIKEGLIWFLRKPFQKLIEKLPKEFLGADGPTGPKAKSSWAGNEELIVFQARDEAI